MTFIDERTEKEARYLLFRSLLMHRQAGIGILDILKLAANMYLRLDDEFKRLMEWTP